MWNRFHILRQQMCTFVVFREYVNTKPDSRDTKRKSNLFCFKPVSLFDFEGDVGVDWSNCCKCSLSRFDKDCALSESVHILFVYSQASWLAGANLSCTLGIGYVPIYCKE